MVVVVVAVAAVPSLLAYARASETKKKKAQTTATLKSQQPNKNKYPRDPKRSRAPLETQPYRIVLWSIDLLWMLCLIVVCIILPKFSFLPSPVVVVHQPNWIGVDFVGGPDNSRLPRNEKFQIVNRVRSYRVVLTFNPLIHSACACLTGRCWRPVDHFIRHSLVALLYHLYCRPIYTKYIMLVGDGPKTPSAEEYSRLKNEKNYEE